MRLLLCLFSLIAGTLQDDMLFVSADSLMVNTVATYTIDFLLFSGNTYPPGSKILITFPAEYASSLSNGLRTCTASDWPVSGATLGCSINNLVLTVSGGFPTSFDDGGFSQLTFTVNNIKNPGYVMTTGTFSGAIQDSSNNQITSASTDGLTLTPGSLSIETITQRVLLAPAAPL